MQRAYGVYLDSYGRPINGATVSVYQSGTSTLASIYSATGDPSAPSGQANPFTTDATGFWGFSAAIGRYDITVVSTVAATRNYPNAFLSDVGGPYLANPMTTQGDMIAGGLAGAVTRVPGNATATPMYVYSANGALPVFKQVAASEVSGLAAFIAANGVASFNGRIGTVLPAANDYTFAQLASKPTTIAGYGITDTLTNTFNGRSGTVVPASGDYSVAQVTGAAPLASPTFTGTVTASGDMVVTGTSGGWGTTPIQGFHTIQGTGAATTWLAYGTSGGIFRGGIQLLDAGGLMRLYVDATNYMQISALSGSSVPGAFTAVSFSGAGTGLTGTAASLTAGNATTATTATAANGLNSNTTTVSVSGSNAPLLNQVLTAVSTTGGTWQYPGLSGANNITTVAAPSGTTSTAAYVMMGISSGSTSNTSARFIVMASGQMANNILNDGCTLQLYYGTGTPPVNGAAVTGTALGISQTRTSLIAGDSGGWAFMITMPTVTPGVAFWVDVALKAVTGGTASITGVTISLFER